MFPPNQQQQVKVQLANSLKATIAQHLLPRIDTHSRCAAMEIMINNDAISNMDAKKKGEPGVTKMTPEQTKAICDYAHEKGYIVASHTESTKGIQVALDGGVDTIEHGAEMTPEQIQEFKDHHAALTCTLSPALPLDKLPPEKTRLNEMCTYNANYLFEEMVRGVKQALEKAGLRETDIARTVSTGYGRVSIPFADAEVTEITCHEE